MKNTMRLLIWIVVPVVTATACKKSVDNENDGGDNPYNSKTETKSAIQKGITVNVNPNIGGYQQALPALYDSTTKRYPLLVFLHGIGELGNGASDLPNAAWNGTPGLIKNKKFPASFSVGGKNYSFIVISPQFKAWPSSKDVNDMINYAISKYRIDTTRMYVSGLSMGGGVTWDYATAYPKRIAAVVPICGAMGPSDSKAKKMVEAGLAVWAFHNEDDPTVSVDNSKGWVNMMNKYKPAVAPKLTLWPTGGHDAWTKATSTTYKEGNMNMYEWMLQYSRSAN